MSNPNPPNQFKPGESGNPNGRPPKGYSITEMMREMLSSKPEVKETLGKVIITKALEGDITAIKTVWQYMDGMPKQAIEHGGELKLLPLIPVNEIRSNNSDNQDIESN